MVKFKQRLIVFDDIDEYGPLMDKLAARECLPGDRPSKSRIIRRAIRAELIYRRMIRPTKQDLLLGYRQGPPGNVAVSSVEPETAENQAGS